MKHQATIVASAGPDSGVQFRRKSGGTSGIYEFLRDVLAVANAPDET